MSDISRAEVASIARREAKKQFEQLSEQQQETAEPSEEDIEADQLAETVMTARDWKTAEEEGLSQAEYVEEYRDVDPSDCDSEAELRRKIGMME